MPLSVIHNSLDDIPENYRDLYTEQDGKFHLTGVTGIKTQLDIDRIQSGLEKERNDHRETRDKLRPWTELGAELVDVQSKLDRFAELEVAASSQKEELDAKLEELTEARVRSRLAPVERENRTVKNQLEEALAELGTLRTEKTQRIIKDRVVASAHKANVETDALDDVTLLASIVFDVTETEEVLTKKNDYGVPVGLSPELFFAEMQPRRPRWWAESVGGNAKGSRSGGGFLNNPWSKDNWNMTAQGRIVTEHGTDKARAMAKAAGTVLGGGRPT